MKHRLLPTALVVLALVVTATVSAATHYDRRWVYLQTNLLVDRNVEDAVALIARASKAGYNGMVLADYKFNILDRMPANYFKNVARVKEAADKAGIEVIPTIFPIGYSAGLLAHDPNLAEGLPVLNAPFVVKHREAALVPDPAAKIANGDLEQTRGDRFVGFSSQDDPGKATFADRDVVHHGKVSCRMQDGGTEAGVNCRLIQKVKVRPHACYKFSCWVKTRDLKLKGEFKLLALAAGKTNQVLTFFDGHLKPTQDWTRLDVVFNSLDETEVLLFAGRWGGQSGTLWVDELALEELALVNVLRRPGCPLTVTSADGQTVYEEEKDFEPVRDEQLGQVPSRGDFSYHHPSLAILLTEKSRIKAGDQLRVSWYHPILTHEYQVMCCLSEPKIYAILKDQAKRVNDLLAPATFFMSHDEIRVAGWCKACQDSKRTPGQLLAANVKRCVEIIKDVNPKAKVVVWNDMFDPHHNAVSKYYLVNGSLEESWKDLPADVIIANWNQGKASAASLKWFADRGHSQILAGYYDSDIENFKSWEAAAKNVPRVTGFLYTTWQHQYDHLEEYGKALQGRK